MLARSAVAIALMAAPLVSGINLFTLVRYDGSANCETGNEVFVMNGLANVCRQFDGSGGPTWQVFDCERGETVSYSDSACTDETSAVANIGSCLADGEEHSSQYVCDEFEESETISIRSGTACDEADQLVNPSAELITLALGRCYAINTSGLGASLKVEQGDESGFSISSYTDTQRCDNTGTTADLTVGVCSSASVVGLPGFIDLVATTPAPTKAPTTAPSSPTKAPTAHPVGVKLVFFQQYLTTDCSGPASLSPNGQGDFCQNAGSLQSTIFNCTSNRIQGYSNKQCTGEATISENEMGQCDPDSTTSNKMVCESFQEKDVIKMYMGTTCNSNEVTTLIAVDICYDIGVTSIKFTLDGTRGVVLSSFEDSTCGVASNTLDLTFDTCVSSADVLNIPNGVFLRVSPYAATASPVAAPTSAAVMAQTHAVLGWCMAVLLIAIIH